MRQTKRYQKVTGLALLVGLALGLNGCQQTGAATGGASFPAGLAGQAAGFGAGSPAATNTFTAPAGPGTDAADPGTVAPDADPEATANPDAKKGTGEVQDGERTEGLTVNEDELSLANTLNTGNPNGSTVEDIWGPTTQPIYEVPNAEPAGENARDPNNAMNSELYCMGPPCE